MTRRTLGALGVVAVLAVVGLLVGVSGDRDDAPARAAAPTRSARNVFAQALAKARATARPGAPTDPADPVPLGDGTSVTVAGAVFDITSAAAVAHVEVVFRSAAGESSAMTGPDGAYRLEVPAGVYRAFVRDDSVLSVGAATRMRIPGPPTPDQAGLPDEALMPQVEATRDLDGVDLLVVRSGRITGVVTGSGGAPVAGAVVTAMSRDGRRSATGSDLAETDRAGRFDMRVPTGGYLVSVSHRQYAATAAPEFTQVMPGETIELALSLARGCIIAGMVTAATGRPAEAGAIERKWGEGVNAFGPAGRIEPDGAFRFATLSEGDITLRAWPWKSAPSNEQTFACKDGARFESVAFRIPDARPDLQGVLVDATGAAVPFAHVDLFPLEDTGMAQQERTDAEGRWAVYSLPAGRYRVSAQAVGRGIVVAELAAPQTHVRLALRGTGSLEGTIAGLTTGMFELEVARCIGDTGVEIDRERRYVRVEAGRFRVDGLPACDLIAIAQWRGHRTPLRATVAVGGVATVAIDPDGAQLQRPRYRAQDDHAVDDEEDVEAEEENDADGGAGAPESVNGE